MPDPWCPARAVAGHEVCVLVACVADHSAAALDSLATQMLAEDELLRAASIVAPSVRHAYLLAHALKRIALSRALAPSLLPVELVFAREAQGKPQLPGAGLHFNLSHSGAFVALAFTRAGPIGVDLEVRRSFDRYRLAAAASLGGGELAQVRASADPALAFLTCWTAKEAYVKATGEGLGKSFKELLVVRSGAGCMVSGDNVHASKTFSHIDAEYVLSACSLARREQPFSLRRVRLSPQAAILGCRAFTSPPPP